MEDVADRIARLKAELDGLRPIPVQSLRRLRFWFDVELTYTSNAIEGNTLTAVETELVIDKGVTIAGKPLKDHLEAIDHYEAIALARDLARSDQPVRETDIRSLHAMVLRRSQPDVAGRYANQGRFVRTASGEHQFPSPVELPSLIGAFMAGLSEADGSYRTAFEAHRRLVAIHPFNDGNGRTARLLMNLLLIRAGHPPVSIRPDDRVRYISALVSDQAGEGSDAFHALMMERLEATLADYVSRFREADSQTLPGVEDRGARWSDA